MEALTRSLLFPLLLWGAPLSAEAVPKLPEAGGQSRAGEPWVFFATPEPARSVVFDPVDKPETRIKCYYPMDVDKPTLALVWLINGKPNVEVFEFNRAGGA